MPLQWFPRTHAPRERKCIFQAFQFSLQYLILLTKIIDTCLNKETQEMYMMTLNLQVVDRY